MGLIHKNVLFGTLLFNSRKWPQDLEMRKPPFFPISLSLSFALFSTSTLMNHQTSP